MSSVSLPAVAVLSRFSPVARLALAVLVVMVLAVIAGPFLSPYSPTGIDPMAMSRPPSAAHWLGTDQFGRDILTRILVGGSATVGLALACTLSSVGVGTAVGLVAGYFGGRIDQLLMRSMDVLLALPSLLIALMILAVFGNSTGILIAAITVMFVPPVSRVARTAAMQVASLPFIDAARIRKESTPGIIVLEILPNMLPVIAVESGLRFSYTILTLASLGFLGLGVQPPTPDWGLMINEGRAYIGQAPWIVFGPALAIVLLVLSINILLDELTI